MAVAVVMDFEGTLEQYDEINGKMGYQPFGKAPAGCLFHWATATAGGIRVVDVWESQEQFEKFSSEQIGPASQAAGVTSAPNVQFIEVHNYLTGG